ncbi:MAG: single-stranded DNA-binding protein [Spirochaetota bacterium]|jgi:single-strand DNA-binding protein|nr:single-stranded DNA-binding protein [Spirochaetota bacterium]
MANDINSVVLVGRLTRDAELKYTASGTAVCKFSIAVNRSRKTGDTWGEEAHFFDIVLWGRQGEAIHQYLGKGKQIAVQGELRQSRWEQNGQNRSKVEVHALNVQLLGGTPTGGGPAPNRGTTGSNQNNSSGYSQNDFNGGPEEFEDDIPF